jgi:hypothetical protein
VGASKFRAQDLSTRTGVIVWVAHSSRVLAMAFHRRGIFEQRSCSMRRLLLLRASLEKFVAAGFRDQHSRRVRYPKEDPPATPMRQ